jgi:hypothetical protein
MTSVLAGATSPKELVIRQTLRPRGAHVVFKDSVDLSEKSCSVLFTEMGMVADVKVFSKLLIGVLNEEKQIRIKAHIWRNVSSPIGMQDGLHDKTSARKPYVLIHTASA